MLHPTLYSLNLYLKLIKVNYYIGKSKLLTMPMLNTPIAVWYACSSSTILGVLQIDLTMHFIYVRLVCMPKGDVWYQMLPVGHNTLANTIPRLLKAAGISGHFTNHSLRATSATHMFDAGIDQQLIMSCTAHSSTSGVGSYKRVTEQLQEKTSKMLDHI